MVAGADWPRRPQDADVDAAVDALAGRRLRRRSRRSPDDETEDGIRVHCWCCQIHHLVQRRLKNTVIYMQQWDIRPEKAGEYAEWADSAVSRLLSVPGVEEFRAFRPVAGDRQAGVTYEFTDLVSWAGWRSDETVIARWAESRAYMDHTRVELRGPSPVVPDPIRPGK